MVKALINVAFTSYLGTIWGSGVTLEILCANAVQERRGGSRGLLGGEMRTSLCLR